MRRSEIAMTVGRGFGRRGRRLGAVLFAAAVVGGVLPAWAGPASSSVGDRNDVAVRAEDPAPPPLQVTIVARQCGEYTDVTANRARNNIQESLRDLGADTLYASGEPISVAKETQGQPDCVAIPNWTFTFGTGYTTGNPNNLSRVTGSNGSATTQASTPELDKFGNPTGQSLTGAVTVTLTPAQAALAAKPNKLWLMGGTPTSPPGSQLNGRADEFGFAALRCAIDNLNGDNVEWISYPSGTSHVFCYAYYIQPPPESATIVVKKQTVDVNGDPLNLPVDLSFQFQGNVSYNDQPFQGAFTVPVPAAVSSGTATFIRGAIDTAAGDTPWDFREVDPTDQGWVVYDIDCVSSSGESQFSIDDLQFKVTVTKLVAGDTLTCTFEDRPQATGPLTLVKITEGGVGGPFGFTIDPPSGDDLVTDVTTTEVEVPELVAEVTSGPPGVYTVTETLPAPTSAGTWAFTDAFCIGTDPTVDVENATFSADIGDGEEVFCIAVNTFTPLASITIEKVSLGGTLTADFFVSEVDPSTGEPGDSFVQSATTVEPGVAATATGDDLTGLPLGTYQIYESGDPDLVTDGGVWKLTGVSCGTIIGGGGVQITLTEESPDITCTFTDTLVPFGTLSVTKVVAGDGSLRTGPISISVTCTDGQEFALDAPAGQPGPFTVSAPIGFLDPTVCTVTETASGVGLAADVAVTWTVTEGDAIESGTGVSVDAATDLGVDTTIVLTDTYTAVPEIAPNFTG